MCQVFRVPELEPLEDDEEVHIAEEKSEEKDLGDKLEPDFKSAFEVDCVEALEDDSTNHMDDGDDN